MSSDEKKLEKPYESNPEKTLITLEQLSQTIEVMTSVVNRLRQHLSEQLEHQLLTQSIEKQRPHKEKIKTNPTNLTTLPKGTGEVKEKTLSDIGEIESNYLKKDTKVIH
tara:strand:- start:4730 stop:5056 length:327 start_codon:yes stop_codon:yes gene_type:complete